MVLSIINETELLSQLSRDNYPYLGEYYAFYSSWFGGVIKNPRLMLLPIDDHMVHRGDGIFESIKSVNRGVYLLDEHLDRLYHSAKQIFLTPPVNQANLKQIILDTLKIADQSDTVIRVYVSRGPGSFSPNPYESVGAQLYIVITRLVPPAAKKYEQGVLIGKTDELIKPAKMTQYKSCNYLPNVLAKKEAEDRGLDYVIGTDPQGFVTESATENILLVDQAGTIVHPPFDYILKGTTMVRACELAREHGMKTVVRTFSVEELCQAREALITGTSLNVLPVVKFEGAPIGEGTPGPVARRLQALMLDDIQSGKRSTPY